MEWWYFPALAIVLMAVVVAVFGKRGATRDFPYRKNHSLFSSAERSFLGVLDEAVGGGYRVFGKVRVGDVVSVESLRNRAARRSAFNKISAKHFDFLLCRPEDLSPIAAIELDDRSHARRKRRERDEFLDDLCDAVELPLIRVPVQRSYTLAAVREQLSAALGARAEGSESRAEQNSAKEGELDAADTDEPRIYGQPAESEAPQCPRCSSPMVRRALQSGAKTGEEFWACKNYPQCRGLLPSVP